MTQCDPTPHPAQSAWALLIKIPSCQNVLLPDFYLGVLVQPLMFIIGHMSPKCLLTPDILDMRDLVGFCMGLVTPCYRGSRNTLFKSIWANWPQNGYFWCSDSTYDQCNISGWRTPKRFDPHLSAQIDLNKVCPVLQDPLLPATSIMRRTMTQLILWMC